MANPFAKKPAAGGKKPNPFGGKAPAGKKAPPFGGKAPAGGKPFKKGGMVKGC